MKREALPPEEDVTNGDEEGAGKFPYVTSFGRGLAVIRSFSAENARLTIADVAKATGLNRATARRFLYTLEADGYVGSEDGRFFLLPRVLELGYAYLASLSIGDVVQEHLTLLANSLHETCSAGVLDGHNVTFVARAQTSRVMTLTLTVGTRVPAYVTALGRVLLAQLPEEKLERYLQTAELRRETERTITQSSQLRDELLRVREQGYSILNEEIEVGVRSVAVPLYRNGTATLAISAAAHASRVSLSALETEFLPHLQATATEIEKLLALQH